MTLYALQSALIAAFHHGAEWEEHCSNPVLGEPAGKVLQAGTEKQEKEQQDHGQPQPVLTGIISGIAPCVSRVLPAPFPRLVRLFAQDPASFYFLSESAEPTIQFSSTVPE